MEVHRRRHLEDPEVRKRWNPLGPILKKPSDTEVRVPVYINMKKLERLVVVPQAPRAEFLDTMIISILVQLQDQSLQSFV